MNHSAVKAQGMERSVTTRFVTSATQRKASYLCRVLNTERKATIALLVERDRDVMVTAIVYQGLGVFVAPQVLTYMTRDDVYISKNLLRKVLICNICLL